MEIKSRFDFRSLVILLYVICFAAYLIFGLTPAGAAHYDVFTNIEIPSIGLNSEVTSLSLEDNQLKTPDTIVGSYSRAKNKTLLIGHSGTVFGDLDEVWVGDAIEYNGASYLVKDIVVERKEDISMRELLSEAETDTLVIMTCAGTYLENNDATHRLLITAEIMTS